MYNEQEGNTKRDYLEKYNLDMYKKLYGDEVKKMDIVSKSNGWTTSDVLLSTPTPNQKVVKKIVTAFGRAPFDEWEGIEKLSSNEFRRYAKRLLQLFVGKKSNIGEMLCNTYFRQQKNNGEEFWILALDDLVKGPATDTWSKDEIEIFLTKFWLDDYYIEGLTKWIDKEQANDAKRSFIKVMDLDLYKKLYKGGEAKDITIDDRIDTPKGEKGMVEAMKYKGKLISYRSRNGRVMEWVITDISEYRDHAVVFMPTPWQDELPPAISKNGYGIKAKNVLNELKVLKS